MDTVDRHDGSPLASRDPDNLPVGWQVEGCESGERISPRGGYYVDHPGDRSPWGSTDQHSRTGRDRTDPGDGQRRR